MPSVDGVVRLLGPQPALVAVLESLVDALRLDGADEPFVRDAGRVEALSLRGGTSVVRVIAGRGSPDAIACLYDALDEIAVAHGDQVGSAPSVAEILTYVAHALADQDLLLPEGMGRPAIFAAVRDAQVHARGRKPATRGARPGTRAEEAQPVRHPKFGRGVLVRTMGEKALVRFDEHGEKVLLARFLVPSD